MPAFKVLKKAIIDLHEESLINPNEEQANEHRTILNHLCAELDQMDKASNRGPAYNVPDLMKKLFKNLGNHFPLSTIFESDLSKIFYNVAGTLEDMLLKKTSSAMVERLSITIQPRNSVFAPKPLAAKTPSTIHTDLDYDSDKVVSPFSR
jgi:hypothetical protein